MDGAHERLARRIRELAEERGVVLTHVPDHAGVSRAHFFDVLRGEKSPTLDWMTKIAAVFEVDVHELLRPAESSA